MITVLQRLQLVQKNHRIHEIITQSSKFLQ